MVLLRKFHVQCQQDAAKQHVHEATKSSWRKLSSHPVLYGKKHQRGKLAIIDELKVCSNTKNLKRGKEIHAEAMESGDHSCNYVAATLINMYAKCGSMLDARYVFDSRKHPDVVAWNALILGYAKNGEGSTALDVFEKMKSQGCAPTSATFIAALKACTSLALGQNESARAGWLERGKEIHVGIGYNSDMNVKNTLIDMYAKCGSMLDARKVFDSIKKPNVVSWNNLLLGYADHGEGATALNLFEEMKSQGCPPDSRTFVAVIKGFGSLALDQNGKQRAECLERAKEMHLQIGCHLDGYVQCTLIDMYAKCGSMVDARQVFDGMTKPNVIAWNALMLGYAENGDGTTALDIFAKITCPPDSITFIAALKACTSLAEQDENRRKECGARGKLIHSQIGGYLNVQMQNTLIDMYAKCGSMAEAHKVFDSIKQADVVSWTALILGYADNGDGVTALDLFEKMKTCGCKPNSITFIAALRACNSSAVDGKAECLDRGKKIHSQIGCHLDMYVQSALIDMYAKCGSMPEAKKVFESMKYPDVVTWNALILGYVQNGEGINTLDAFARMKSQGCPPSRLTFAAALKACTALLDQGGRAECLERGKEIHLQIGSMFLDVYVQSTLIDMYSKCGCMTEARKVFDSMKNPDVVSWNALILGYAKNGEGIASLDLFARMKSRGYVPDHITFAAVLKACSLLGALESGSKIHADFDNGVDFDPMLLTCLVDFYGKCGSLVEAHKVFDSNPRTRNLITWNSLLAGYSRLGDTKAVFKLFREMTEAAFQPDAVTFLCILTCCSHAGLVEKADEFFKAMSMNYGVAPSVDHYTCMIDIFGRSNKLDDAMALLQSMPFCPNAVVWMTLLGACRKWKNVGLGKLAFKSLVCVEEVNAASYVLMAHIYGRRGMWEEQKMVLESLNT